ncbi:nucleotidyltransferase domain-containing protein [Bacillus spongiae]|uniref:Nucleotidyltransferase domain-containing protein n=1 Tax=Bacillus spongiae TaxID=2683610 RepID=A0ABU8HAD5_9BACI
MKQDEAVKSISQSLIDDPMVQAIFLKGSMGRGENDEYSDVDLYCLVDENDEKEFLANRLRHLEAYRNILFSDDIFIIAPQIIVVYDNLLHVDFFTVTPKSFKEKDFFQVIYDPKGLLTPFQLTQNLLLSPNEFDVHVTDVAWFLFQYNKAYKRGNALWAVDMLHQVMTHLSKVLLHRYKPERAQLGLKALESLLPSTQLDEVRKIFTYITPDTHELSVQSIISLLQKEIEWIESTLEEGSQAGSFMKTMMNELECIS